MELNLIMLGIFLLLFTEKARLQFATKTAPRARSQLKGASVYGSRGRLTLIREAHLANETGYLTESKR